MSLLSKKDNTILVPINIGGQKQDDGASYCTRTTQDETSKNAKHRIKCNHNWIVCVVAITLDERGIRGKGTISI